MTRPDPRDTWQRLPGAVARLKQVTAELEQLIEIEQARRDTPAQPQGDEDGGA